jgi:hypothetical protein
MNTTAEEARNATEPGLRKPPSESHQSQPEGCTQAEAQRGRDTREQRGAGHVDSARIGKEMLARSGSADSRKAELAGHPHDTDDTFRQAFGTSNPEMIRRLLSQAAGTVPSSDLAGKCRYALAALQGISPADGLEGLLAVQMIGAHNLAMEFLQRAMVKDQTLDVVDHNVNRATRLLRLFLLQIEALNRYRGKGQQNVVVKHVHVNRGGKAIVGAVARKSQGGGDSDKTRA